MVRFLLLGLGVSLALAGSLQAEEATPTPRRIGLPQAGLSFVVQPGWTFDGHAGGIAMLTKDEARVHIERVHPAPPDLDAALRADTESLQAKHEGLKTSAPRPLPVFGADAGTTSQYRLEGRSHLLGYFRAVDGRVVRVRAAAPTVKRPLVQEAGRLLRSLDLTPYAHPLRHVEWGRTTAWTIDLPKGWRAFRDSPGVIRLAAARDAGSFLRVHTADARVELHGDEASKAKLARIASSFRKGAEPGPRVALPSDRFPRADSPRVRFALPAGWVLRRPASRMRLADVSIPGEPPIVAAVFFFGSGQGGSVADNIKRWKGQLEIDEELPEERVVDAKGVKATLLDMVGRKPGTGDDAPRLRMLAAVLELEGGPLFVKLMAPPGAVAPHVEAFESWLASFRRPDA